MEKEEGGGTRGKAGEDVTEHLQFYSQNSSCKIRERGRQVNISSKF